MLTLGFGGLGLGFTAYPVSGFTSCSGSFTSGFLLLLSVETPGFCFELFLEQALMFTLSGLCGSKGLGFFCGNLSFNLSDNASVVPRGFEISKLMLHRTVIDARDTLETRDDHFPSNTIRYHLSFDFF